MTIAPELLSKREFVLELTFLDSRLPAGGMDRIREIEATHLAAIRKAVAQQRPVHRQNVDDYASQVPELRSYTYYGNYGVFDSAKPAD